MAIGAPRKSRVSIPGVQVQLHEQARMRLIFLVMCLMMAYLAVGLRLFDLSILREKPGIPAAAAGVRPLDKPLRASIVDRNGTLMAASLKMASVYANPALVEKPEALAKQLAAILPEQGYAELLRKLRSGKKFVWIQRNVTPRQEYAINALGEPALGFQEEERRIYPDAGLAAHVVGYTDVDGRGIAGIEKSFESRLAAGGDPVRLTIDLRLQHILRRELGRAQEKFRAKAGIGMVMDVATGEILAMVSLPDFDPSRPAAATDQQKFNRATLGVFEMGSTFKLFSTAAALDSGLVHLGDVFDAVEPIKAGRFTISDYHAKRRALTVPEIFIYSSNIGTARMAALLGNDRVRDFYRGLGFLAQAKVELPERGTPLYPSPWRDISTLTTSFGHGIAITPLHLVRAAAGLVNGGMMPEATLVRSESYPPGEMVVRPETSRQLRQLLELTVAGGTGNNAYVEGYGVGGKTGTAEKNTHGNYQSNSLFSSFLGAFPIQAPRYAVLAILDEPQGTQDTAGYATGGWTAAPVVARVVEQMGPLYGMQPDMARGRKEIGHEMGRYLRELKEGNAIASVGTDH